MGSHQRSAIRLLPSFFVPETASGTPEFSRILLRLGGHRAEEFVEVGRDRFAERQEPDGGLVLLAGLAVEFLEDLLRRLRRAEQWVEYRALRRSEADLQQRGQREKQTLFVAGQSHESELLVEGDRLGVLGIDEHPCDTDLR